MNSVQLFQISDGKANELASSQSDLERPLQTLIENNLEELLAVKFLATEFSTGKTHKGRIDTLGIDEDNCPVIIEYKRSVGENVINQGLFYLDWLMDHKAEFELLVMKKLGAELAGKIDWSGPRLICIAADFTKYDGHAVQQMNRSILLVRYRKFGDGLLLLEVSATSGGVTGAQAPKTKKLPAPAEPVPVDVAEENGATPWLSNLSAELKALFESVEGYLVSLGDDVVRKDVKLYVAFKRLRNFVCVGYKGGAFVLWLKLDPATVTFEPGFSRDVSNIGHWGTGDVEVTVHSHDDLNKAKGLMLKAYEG